MLELVRYLNHTWLRGETVESNAIACQYVICAYVLPNAAGARSTIWNTRGWLFVHVFHSTL